MIKLALIIFSFSLLISCSDDIGSSYEPPSDFSGVSTFNEKGEKIEEVDSDWHPECYEIVSFGDNHLCIFSAHPLPAIDTITLNLGSAINGEIKLWLALTEGIVEKEIYTGNIGVQYEQIKFTFDEDILYRNVVYRLFIETTDTASGETKLYYGDVLWKNR